MQGTGEEGGRAGHADGPARPRFRRVLLKLSGEALLGSTSFGISPEVIGGLAEEIAGVKAMGVQLGLVVGGGNIFRGVAGSAKGMDRASADQIGMLATVMNGLALRDALERCGCGVRVLSAVEVGKFAEPFIRSRALKHLEKGRIVIFVAGTGNPFFTTDTAAALRALEIGADVLLKATKVDGVYDRDPVEFPDAVKYDTLTYREVFDLNLRVMDHAAISLAMEADLPVIVFNMQKPGNIGRVIAGQPTGTLVVARQGG